MDLILTIVIVLLVLAAGSFLWNRYQQARTTRWFRASVASKITPERVDRAVTVAASLRAQRIEEDREAAVAGYLQPGEQIVENTSARMQPDPEDKGVGVLYLTNRRLVWHLPDAMAHEMGGLPLYIFREGAFKEDTLVMKMDVESGLDTLWFQLYPGPISSALVEDLFRSVEESRRNQGKTRFRRSTDPDELLMR